MYVIISQEFFLTLCLNNDYHVVTHKVKHILCRYFPENWNCERGHFICRVILHSYKYIIIIIIIIIHWCSKCDRLSHDIAFSILCPYVGRPLVCVSFLFLYLYHLSLHLTSSLSSGHLFVIFIFHCSLENMLYSLYNTGKY